MTKEEGAVMAERLVRIWVPGRELQNWMEWRNSLHLAEWEIVGPQFQFWAQVREEVFFLYLDPTNDGPGAPRQRLLELRRIQNNEMRDQLDFTTNPERLSQWGEGEGLDRYGISKQFADQWLDFFRRGCWLCGCGVEASAHEKAGWMEGFSREELETWDLKF